jgi:hypothetical protein
VDSSFPGKVIAWVSAVFSLGRNVRKSKIRWRMPEIATYAELRAWGARGQARMLERAGNLSGKNVFLSHTTADDGLVAGVVLILEENGADVYVDHQDPSVDGADCTAIANHLRNVMRQCSRLVMLASPKSKDSKWIPWELGLGDGLER